jgi:hypothetical protein
MALLLHYGKFKLAQKPSRVVRFFEFLKNLTFLVLLTVPESKNNCQFWLFQGLDHSNKHIIPPEDLGSTWKSFHCFLVSLPYLTQSNKSLLLSEIDDGGRHSG